MVLEVKEDYGPIEHQIRIENLTPTSCGFQYRTVWLLTGRSSRNIGLNISMSKRGRTRPSSVGTHEVNIADGYRWTGTSSTYGDIDESRPREIIPWSLVEHPDSQSGWYLGIEFSGRTRVSLERKGDSLHGAAGLNPDPAPFRTRLEPESRLRHRLYLSAASSWGPTGPEISCARGCARYWESGHLEKSRLSARGQ